MFFDPETWVAIAFVILMVVFGYLGVFKKAMAALDHRADRIKAEMRAQESRFPKGLRYAIVYDTTPFIRESVHAVFHTLRDAVILVAIVILLFRNRATINVDEVDLLKW